MQALLKTKAQQLLFCQPQQVPNLQQEIQRLRIVAALFKEIDSSETNRDLYKEMNLLNRMTVGKDLEEEAIRKRADEDIAKGAEKLRGEYGVSPAAANRIARAISSVGGMTVAPGAGDSEDPESVEPDPIH